MGFLFKTSVIATGGSAVYSDRAMVHLKSGDLVIFPDVDLPTLESRVHDFRTRGLARRPDQDFTDFFHERFTLYTKYADMTIKRAGLIQEEKSVQESLIKRERKR